MAAWVGAAKTLVALKDRWHGAGSCFIAQPAEEKISGAKAMLDDGLLTRFPRPDFGFAPHVSPAAAGTVAIKAGTNTSASDSVEILFKGRGGHGSMPSATIDPIVIASRFVTDVQTIISREKDAAQFGVITVGSFQAGTVGNIIPDSAQLKLTLRSFSPQVRKQLLEGVRRAATASALLADAPAPEVKVIAGTAAVVSDEAMANRTAQVFARVFGKAFTLTPSNGAPLSASEDYSEFVAAGVPSLFFGVGVTDPAAVTAAQAGGSPVPVNHSPYFAPVPEASIKTATRADDIRRHRIASDRPLSAVSASTMSRKARGLAASDALDVIRQHIEKAFADRATERHHVVARPGKWVRSGSTSDACLGMPSESKYANIAVIVDVLEGTMGWPAICAAISSACGIVSKLGPRDVVGAVLVAAL